MSKILLVEDDQNLSEIYQARLSAEGYEVISASNGEDALAVAAKEKPDLVISDVMMPRVSGFEMLDILRHTDGMQAVKTIMLTALGQDNDRSKASELGADRYLVKSQVTLEDIVNAAKELLGDEEAEPEAAQPSEAPASPASEAAAPAPAEPPTPPAPAPEPSTPPSEPVSPPPADNDAPVAPSTAVPVQPVPAPAPTPTPAPATVPEPTTAPAAEPAAAVASPTDGQLAQQEAELAQTLASATPDSDGQPATSQPAGTSVTNDDSSQPNLDEPVPDPASAPVAAESSQPNEPQPTTDNDAATPASEPPAPAQTTPAANHDEVLAAALKELEGESTNSSVPDPAPASLNEPAPAEPAAQNNANQTNSQAVTGRKIIQPPEATSKPDINQLLAKEEGGNPPNEQNPGDEAQPKPDDPGNIAL